MSIASQNVANNLEEFRDILQKNLDLVNNILDPKAIPMGKDWAWAELPDRVIELETFLKYISS